MRVMGIDVGEKRLGVAVTDPLGITAQPLTCIDRAGTEEDVARIEDLVKELGVEKIVLGYPVTLRGSAGTSVLLARRLGNEIAERLNMPVEYYDERLTTVESERILKRAGLRRKKRKAVIDKVAAALILEGYLKRGSD